MSRASSSFSGRSLIFFTDRRAIEKGHRQEGLALGFVDFVDGADIRVIESSRGFGFLNETRLVRVIFEQVAGEKLQGNGAFEFRSLPNCRSLLLRVARGIIL